MAETVVELDGVGKRYRLGEHHGSGMDLRETLARLGGRLRGGQRAAVRDFWSVRNVSFSVAEGQALGIIGRNGAGKSTLLRIISNITTPTEGTCRSRGRVGSLLEVGTGFHGELTGIENTYLNGAILGMSRREVAARMDEIVGFAGLERFMDTPVKRYSSGMYLRLGFAIAAHMAAEILLVDEVLAVGDAEFQRRCLGKMSEVEASGRTVLFVSHNLDALVRLCPTAVWLEQGSVQMIGSSESVAAAYLRSGAAARDERPAFDADPDAGAYVTAVDLADEAGVRQQVLDTRNPATITIDLTVAQDYPGLDVAVMIATAAGTTILDESLSDGTERAAASLSPGRYRLHCPLPPILSPGSYTISVWLGSTYETGRFHDNVLAFTIEGDGSKQRVVKLGTPWAVEIDP